ncbi:hypothetical protein K503DRAFT_793344 [Rhizopogon vinicolor AM-OR11-026]|uniref:X-box-binding protein 1 n=1 Tax=Rhizopogon vinicolor AM-OR11-026 TaxID=1314800 RepID=A0A1B7MVG4_9AGAM|nr:hypothetical protein K503DRAFT_793344 [Rhizopogon vinicolor AM-OR11-026]
MSSSPPASFVNPSNLSLPSSSLKRHASPSSSRADSPDVSVEEPPRKRPRSGMTPEERKEARAHRNRIAAQNSRDRRKAQFSLLERRVAELEEENRRLRAGVPMSDCASPSSSSVSEPEVATIQQEQERERKRAEEQRERENLELRERIRTLEMGYEAVLRTLATQGTNTPELTAVPETSIRAPTFSSARAPSPVSITSSTGDSTPPTASSPKSTTLATISYPLSPAPTHSTLADSPVMFSGDSFDFPLSPTFSLSDLTRSSSPAPIDAPKETLDLSTGHAPTRHLARVATTAVPAVSLQRVGSIRLVTGPTRAIRCAAVLRSSLKTRQPQTQPSRACSQRFSRRRRLALALFQALALRQKTRIARRC